MSKLTINQLKKINKTSLAQKHSCSGEYVKQVLLGDKKAKSKKAKAILEDGLRIIEILEPQPKEITEQKQD